MPSPKLSSGDGKLPSGDGSRAALLELDGDPTTTALAHNGHLPLNGRRRSADRTEQPDMLLDTLVNVQEIKLEVHGLKANVQVPAEVANPVKRPVGADVSLDRVTLTIAGVEVKTLLGVRLDEVRTILDRALTLIIEHPEILEILAKTGADVTHEAGEVGGGEGLPTPVPGGAGDAAAPPAGQPGQPVDKGPGPVTDQSGPLVQENPLDEAGQTPTRAPALGADSDGVLERAIRLLSLLDRGGK
jgi:hypothetical protein